MGHQNAARRDAPDEIRRDALNAVLGIFRNAEAQRADLNVVRRAGLNEVQRTVFPSGADPLVYPIEVRRTALNAEAQRAGQNAEARRAGQNVEVRRAGQNVEAPRTVFPIVADPLVYPIEAQRAGQNVEAQRAGQNAVPRTVFLIVAGPLVYPIEARRAGLNVKARRAGLNVVPKTCRSADLPISRSAEDRTGARADRLVFHGDRQLSDRAA